MPEGGLSAGQLLKDESRGKSTDFYRSAARVGILGALASTAYLLWWLYQFFHLTRREGFPRARAFWWIFLPIYGWLVIYRQFDDLDKAALALGRQGLGANLPFALLVISNVAGIASNRLNTQPSEIIAFIASTALFGVAAYLVQLTANDYLKTKYPEATGRGMTWGEITATVIGLLVLVVEIAAVLVPDALTG